LIEEGKIKDGERIGTVLSGGNIDLLKFNNLISDNESNN